MNENEAIGLINHLLDGLHQADLTNFGSHLQIVYVASGGQHVNKQFNLGKTLPSPPNVGKEKGVSDLPDVLATDGAMTLWRKAQQAGYVDEHYQPLLSRTQAALLADAIAEKLGIRQKWKTFEMLWNRKNMRSDYNLALRQQQSLDFLTELKRMI